MSATPTAPFDSAATSRGPLGARSWRRDGGSPGRIRTRADGRVYGVLAVASLALAALTLLFPSTPTYDPWSWLIWGREVMHLDLHTTGGPSWKPLPVLFTAVFSLFGGAAPDLWLVVARGGAIMAVASAFRLAYRLTGRPGVPAFSAGLIAAMGLLISSSYVRTMGLGNSEGLLVAFALWGIERQLDGCRRQAFFLFFLAALLRPEVWPFLGLYGLWLWREDRGATALIAICFALVPALWFLPELWGSGNLLRAADRAQNPNANSAAFAKQPWLQVLKQAWPLIITPIKLGALVALALAVRAWLRRREDLVTIVLAGLAIGWIALVAAMTQGGFSGNPRYLILGMSIVSVLGGVGWGRVVAAFGSFVGRRFGTPVVIVAGLVAFAVIFAGTGHWSVPRFRQFKDVAHALRYQADLRFDLERAVDRAGGPRRLLACGPAFTGQFEVPLVAWYLSLHSLEVHSTKPGVGAGPQGLAVQSKSTRAAGMLPQNPLPPGYHSVIRVGTTTLSASCPAVPAA
jgi:hypothetical protein